MKIIKKNKNRNINKSKKCKIIKCGMASLAVILSIVVVKNVSLNDSQSQNATLAEQLMEGVYPIGTTIFGSTEKAAVYLDNNGNRISATSDYQILECNGMNYVLVGYVFENENGVALFYTKEDVKVIQQEENKGIKR